jgi:hypothetical protein
LVCTDTAKDPTVTWARAFQTAPGYYTAAAYIKNNNVGSGAKNVKYSFQLFDDKNSLVKEYTGTLDLPPIATIPVIVPNITVGNRTVTRAYFAFSARPVWSKVIPNKVPKLYVSEQKHSDDWTTVRATLSNTSDIDVANATAAVVLFDSENVARAASKSLVSLVPAHGTGEVVFTWPSVDGDIVRAEITVLPSF